MKKIALCLAICILLSFLLSGCTNLADSGIFGINIAGKNRWLDASNIVKVEEYTRYHGVEPSHFQSVYYTLNKDEIGKTVDHYGSFILIPIPFNNIKKLDGGSSKTVTFTLTDGSTKELCFHQGYYIHNGAAHRVVNISKYDPDSEMDRYTLFIANKDAYPIFTNADTPQQVGMANGTDWKLKVFEVSKELLYEAKAYIEYDYTTLYIISDTKCYVKSFSGFYEYYEIHEGETFAHILDMIAESPLEE